MRRGLILQYGLPFALWTAIISLRAFQGWWQNFLLAFLVGVFLAVWDITHDRRLR